MTISSILVLFFISFLASFFTNAFFRSISKKNKILIDLPDKSRKFHKRPTPLTGGISILFGSIFAIILSSGIGAVYIEYSIYNTSILICSFLIVFVFIIDDGFGISPRVRLLAQISICSLLIALSGIYLEDLGNLFGIGNLYLGVAGQIFTVFCAVGIMNSFNMLDGINGLCSGITAIIFIFLGIFYSGFIGTQLIFALGAIFGFLVFNLGVIGRKRWVFLGDHGSNLLGFLTAFALIGASQDTFFDFRPVTALWFVFIPLLDCLGLIIKRLKRGVGPFDPDRDHLHHRFMDAGYSQKETLIIILIASVLFAFFGVFLQEFASESMSMILFCFFSLLFYYVSHLIKMGYFGNKNETNT